MRILVVATIYLPEMDGHVRLIHNHACALAKRNHSVDLVTFKRKPSYSEEVIDNVHVLRVTIPRIRRRYTSQFLRLYGLVKGILKMQQEKARVDIIYATGLVPGVAALLTHFFTHSKVVLLLADLTGMSDPNLFSHRMYRIAAIILLSMSNLTIFPTYFARNLVLGRSEKYSNKIVVIAPGTDLALFSPDNNKERKDVQDQIILYAGVLRRRKGLDVLINSFGAIADKFPNAKLVFVGEGGAKPSLENLVSKLGLSERVFFEGRVSDQELRKFHSAASIYVVPTRFDAYATSLVEAMAMGKAVISTKGTAPSEIVQDMKSGLLVKFGDVQELSSALTLLLSDRELADSMGREAFKRVQEEYSLEKSVKKMEDEFLRLLQ